MFVVILIMKFVINSHCDVYFLHLVTLQCKCNSHGEMGKAKSKYVLLVFQ